MLTNPYILERMANDKLAELRSEGMRSQMIARAGLQDHKKIFLPDLRTVFRRLFRNMANHSLRQSDKPSIHNTLGL